VFLLLLYASVLEMTRLTFNYCDQPKALMYEAFRWMCFF